MDRLRASLAAFTLGVLSIALVACDGAEANGGDAGETEAPPTATSPANAGGDGAGDSTTDTGTPDIGTPDEGRPDGDTPTSSDDPVDVDGPATPIPDEGFDRVEAAAPIEEFEVLVLESFPVQYRLHIVSGLPSGCAHFERIDVERDGTTFHVSVINTVPAPDSGAVCTMIYGTIENTVDLGTGLESGTQYTVIVNDQQTTFVAQ